ncbi:MAG: hypothetical protein B7Z08_03525 [Sphingomonadales bacterium 32-68-7]|nr:MAG: hypothetical protein B7Z33_05350 [Sphingomonadales bacterium 12-68-11]OYX09822.1 MAG: hypothetical protein B7Z08_03525 [Sphingomonadales bacterium 32-68-7]
MKARFWPLLAAAALGGSAVQAQGPEVAAGLEFNHMYMAISVDDLEAVSAFYVDKLGFAVEKNASLGQAVQFRWLTNGTSRIELIKMTGSQAGPERRPPPGHIGVRGFAHLALLTPDIAATRASLVAKGVTTAGQISDLPSLGIKAMFVVDPEGNPIEIVQQL